MPDENQQTEEFLRVITYDPYLSERLEDFAHLPNIGWVRKTKNPEVLGEVQFVHYDLPRDRLYGTLDCLDAMLPYTTYVVINNENTPVRIRGINGSRIPITVREEQLRTLPKNFPIEIKKTHRR